MKSPYRIEMLVFENGERYPLLINNEDGMPMHNPTLFITSELRNRGNAESTMVAGLRAIMFVYAWGIKNKFDIEDRFNKGQFLTRNEVELLCNEARSRYDEFCAGISEKQDVKQRSKSRTVHRLHMKKSATAWTAIQKDIT